MIKKYFYVQDNVNGCMDLDRNDTNICIAQIMTYKQLT